MATDEKIECTPEHPFYVAGRGFVEAKDLGIGTSIVTRAGPAVQVTRIVRHAAPAMVYNFVVEETHTYFVGTGSGGVEVHNGPCQPNWGKAAFAIAPDGTAIPTSASELEQGFQDAGFAASPTRGAGMTYTGPDGMQYRVMDAGGSQSDRLITYGPKDDIRLPWGAKLPGGNLSAGASRDLTHFPLNP